MCQLLCIERGRTLATKSLIRHIKIQIIPAEDLSSSIGDLDFSCSHPYIPHLTTPSHLLVETIPTFLAHSSQLHLVTFRALKLHCSTLLSWQSVLYCPFFSVL
jgi:hypothetical protein